jgi:hypothetical protein
MNLRPIDARHGNIAWRARFAAGSRVVVGPSRGERDLVWGINARVLEREERLGERAGRRCEAAVKHEPAADVFVACIDPVPRPNSCLATASKSNMPGVMPSPRSKSKPGGAGPSRPEKVPCFSSPGGSGPLCSWRVFDRRRRTTTVNGSVKCQTDTLPIGPRTPTACAPISGGYASRPSIWPTPTGSRSGGPARGLLTGRAPRRADVACNQILRRGWGQ